MMKLFLVAALVTLGIAARIGNTGDHADSAQEPLGMDRSSGLSKEREQELRAIFGENVQIVSPYDFDNGLNLVGQGYEIQHAPPPPREEERRRRRKGRPHRPAHAGVAQ